MGYRVLADVIEEDPRSSDEQHYFTAKLVCSIAEDATQARELMDELGIDLDAVAKVRAALKDSAAA